MLCFRVNLRGKNEIDLDLKEMEVRRVFYLENKVNGKKGVLPYIKVPSRCENLIT